MNHYSNWKKDAMSSAFLTSSDMNMIGGLLIKGQRKYPEQDPAFFTGPARLLVKRFQAGLTNESGLREALDQYLDLAVIANKSIDRWDDDGGAPSGSRA